MQAKRNLYLLALGVFGITSTEFGVIGVLPDIAISFNIPVEKAGWLLSSFALIVALSGPLLVSLLSSTNKKRLLLYSLFLFFICNILSALANNFYYLLIIRMIPAFFHPVFWSVALSIAAATSAPENRSRATGIVFSGLTIATVIGIPMATFISDLTNWRWSFLVTGFINLTALINLQLYLPSTEYKASPANHSITNLLKNTTLWINILLAFFIITAMYATYGYMADFIKSVTRMNGIQVSLMFFLFGFTGIGGNYLAGRFMSKYPHKTSLSFIILLTFLHLCLLLLGSSFIPMVVITVFWGLIHSGGFLISNLTVVSSTSNSPEFINSLFTSCGNFGVTAGALLGGQIITGFGIQNVAWGSVGCLLLALLILVVKTITLRKVVTT